MDPSQHPLSDDVNEFLGERGRHWILNGVVLESVVTMEARVVNHNPAPSHVVLHIRTVRIFLPGVVQTLYHLQQPNQLYVAASVMIKEPTRVGQGPYTSNTERNKCRQTRLKKCASRNTFDAYGVFTLKTWASYSLFSACAMTASQAAWSTLSPVQKCSGLLVSWAGPVSRVGQVAQAYSRSSAVRCALTARTAVSYCNSSTTCSKDQAPAKHEGLVEELRCRFK